MSEAVREIRRVLITVKTYPTPSMKYVETVWAWRFSDTPPQWGHSERQRRISQGAGRRNGSPLYTASSLP